MCFGSLKYFFVYRAKRRVFYRPFPTRAFPFPLNNSMYTSISVKEISSKIFKDVFHDMVRQVHLLKNDVYLYLLVVIYYFRSYV